MGGKRPDQYRIAPDEGGATDYKNYPNEPDDIKARGDRRRATKDTPWSKRPKPVRKPAPAEEPEGEEPDGQP